MQDVASDPQVLDAEATEAGNSHHIDSWIPPRHATSSTSPFNARWQASTVLQYLPTMTLADILTPVHFILYDQVAST
jgi:hypothetical protein